MHPAGNPTTGYTHSMHASPRASASAAPDFERFRRPRTPEYKAHDISVRDHRANSAGSPPRAIITTPETQRYSTPQAYPPRNPSGASGSQTDDRRDPYMPHRVPNPNAVPPRPSSQPIYNGPQARMEPQRVLNESSRQESSYGRSSGYAEREREEMIYRDRERARHEDEKAQRRDRERRELGYSGNQSSSAHDAPGYGRQYSQQQPGIYGSPHEPREPNGWAHRSDAAGLEQLHQQPPPTTSSTYDYARPPAQNFSGRTEERYAPQDGRYPPSSYGGPPQQQSATATGVPYGSPPQERRAALAQNQQSLAYHSAPLPSGTGLYRQQESPRKLTDEGHQLQQRTYLGVQSETNRGGRRSPLPQAVQGAQGQMSGPGSEPGIKNEFGKMFGGIGSGVGGIGSQSGGSVGAQTPFSNSGPLRREDLESVVTQEAAHENGGHKLARSNSRGGSGSRRRRLKDEGAEDDSSGGRRTPSGRKRTKQSHTQRQ